MPTALRLKVFHLNYQGYLMNPVWFGLISLGQGLTVALAALGLTL